MWNKKAAAYGREYNKIFARRVRLYIFGARQRRVDAADESSKADSKKQRLKILWNAAPEAYEEDMPDELKWKRRIVTRNR